MNNSIVTLQYNDQIAVNFTNNAWFNATEVAKNFGKKTNDWLRLESTKEYIACLEELAMRENPASVENQLVRTEKGGSNGGGGSWFHPKLAVSFARWLDVRFAVWCDMQIDKLLKPIPNALRDLPPQTLTPAMKRHINKRVNWLVKNQVGTTYFSIAETIRETFNVNKRELIPAKRYHELCALLGCEPDPKALQGELVEPAKLEYQLPKGMVLIAESELATLQERRKNEWSGDGYASIILGINDNSRLVINPMGDVTTIMRLTENDFVGTFETIVRELKLRGFHVVKDCPENKLETIVKIAQLSA